MARQGPANLHAVKKQARKEEEQFHAMMRRRYLRMAAGGVAFGVLGFGALVAAIVFELVGR